ncbi:hypothetical protein C8Q80DRAFT_1209224 [Daedaleopsis nitida]|nr:hypothetical protein C8Q80DRAFT_1209224 [Daedaleopsis nitida]
MRLRRHLSPTRYVFSLPLLPYSGNRSQQLTASGQLQMSFSCLCAHSDRSVSFDHVPRVPQNSPKPKTTNMNILCGVVRRFQYSTQTRGRDEEGEGCGKAPCSAIRSSTIHAPRPAASVV